MDAETDRRKSGVFRHRAHRQAPDQKAVAVGDAIRQAIDGLGLTTKFREQRALSLWPQVVGQQIAAVTQADVIRYGELLVSVAHDTWRHRLLFERENIRQRLNQAVGEDVVRLIRFTK